MNKPTKKPKKPLIIAAVIAALIVIAVILQLTGTVHFISSPAKNTSTSTATGGSAGENTKGVSSQGNQYKQNSNSSSNSNGKSGGSGGQAMLIAPTGDFVSDHHPNLSGSPAPNSMTSACNTTPYATCQISFTNTPSGEVRYLPEKTTDINGAAAWSWKLQDIELSKGTWKIEATAKLDGQTKTASDAMNLEVAP